MSRHFCDLFQTCTSPLPLPNRPPRGLTNCRQHPSSMPKLKPSERRCEDWPGRCLRAARIELNPVEFDAVLLTNGYAACARCTNTNRAFPPYHDPRTFQLKHSALPSQTHLLMRKHSTRDCRNPNRETPLHPYAPFAPPWQICTTRERSNNNPNAFGLDTLRTRYTLL